MTSLPVTTAPAPPTARGPWSELVLALLAGDPARDPLPAPDLGRPDDPLGDDDLQLALWTLYELHYRGLHGVDPAWEWAPAALVVRRRIETMLEDALLTSVAPHVDAALAAPGDLAERFFALVEDFPGPGTSSFVARSADRDQVLELLAHRSVYQLKEADPHTFVLPRLHGEAKARFVEIQYDEYGSGRPDRVHQELFARALAQAGLDDRYGGYVDPAPGVTLALGNVVSLLSLHRRWRGAAVGHLAAVEASSSIPCRLYAAGVRRVGLGDGVAEFFDEHVEADAVHEQLAVRGACSALVAAEPHLERDLFSGAAAYLLTEVRFAEHLLGAWERGTTGWRASDALVPA